MNVVYITAPSVQVAKDLARSLVEKRLVACVNIVPAIVSVYRWEGEVNTDDETLLICKTQKSLFSSLRDHVKSIHPYKVPEIIAVDIVDSLPAYASWIAQETSSSDSQSK